MELKEAVRLIKHEKASEVEHWLDLGSGNGLFSLALTEYLVDGSTISCIDKNAAALKQVPVKQNNITIEKIPIDFIKDEWPVKQADGIMMANALHFVKDKHAFLQKAISYLKNRHSFLIVEYDSENGNQWVPHPISYGSLQKFFAEAGYASISHLGEMRSIYNRSNIYAALIRK